MPRVFVSGCFDLLHSGHVQFLEQAAELGELRVALGSDATIHELKGRHPVCPQQERLFVVRALRCVEHAFISTGRGTLDFACELRAMRPDVFVVNTDGHTPAKQALCAELGIEYRVLSRAPARGLPPRSSTSLRSQRLGLRIDLAGGWLDQPFVSRLHSGSVIVVSIEPHPAYADRSGLATSTHATAKRLWGVEPPPGNPIEIAKALFACENPPGTTAVSGSQDALGIVLPGISRFQYEGSYWPEQIEQLEDPATLAWLEQHLFLKWICDRPCDFDVLRDKQLSAQNVSRLAFAADQCWQAIQRQNAVALGEALTDTFRAQVTLFPRMTSPPLQRATDALMRTCHGGKLAGAGGGGYAVVVADECPLDTIPICIRRSRVHVD